MRTAQDLQGKLIEGVAENNKDAKGLIDSFEKTGIDRSLSKIEVVETKTEEKSPINPQEETVTIDQIFSDPLKYAESLSYSLEQGIFPKKLPERFQEFLASEIKNDNKELLQSLVAVLGREIKSGRSEILNQLENPVLDFILKQTILLHVAVSVGNLDAVSLFLKNNAPVNKRNLEGSTPLHIAAKNNQAEIAKWLLDKGASTQCRDINRCTPAEVTTNEVIKGHIKEAEINRSSLKSEVVETKTEEKSPINPQEETVTIDQIFSDPLKYAESLSHFLDQGIFPKKLPERFQEFLASEIKNENQELLQSFIAFLHRETQGVFGTEILDQLSNSLFNFILTQTTLLHNEQNKNDFFSNPWKHHQKLSKLLEKNICPKELPESFQKFLTNSIENENKELLQSFIAFLHRETQGLFGTEILDKLNNSLFDFILTQTTILHNEEDKNDFFSNPWKRHQKLSKLLEKNICPKKLPGVFINFLANEIKKENQELLQSFVAFLHREILSGRSEILNQLENPVLDFILKQTILLHVAVSVGNLDAVSLFLKNNAPVNKRNLEGSTPLHIAAKNNQAEIAKWLLDKGASTQCRDIKRCTPAEVTTNEVIKDHIKKAEMDRSPSKSGVFSQTASSSKQINMPSESPQLVSNQTSLNNGPAS